MKTNFTITVEESTEKRASILTVPSGLNGLVCLVTLFVILLPGTVYSQSGHPGHEQFTPEEITYLKDKKEITMCVDPDWMPLEKIEGGKHVGISADYITLFQHGLGVPIVLVPTASWLESLDFAKARKCDIFSLAMATPEREEYMAFTKPYLNIPLVLASKNDKPFIDDIAVIVDHKLGVVRGYAFGELLRKRYPEMQIIDVESVDDGLNKVARGEIYGFIGTLATVGYSIQLSYANELKVAGKFDQRWQLGIATRKDEPLLHTAFDKVIASIDKSTHQQILNKWIAIKYEQGVDYSLLFRVLVVVAIVILLLLYRNFALGRYSRKLKTQNLEILRQTELLQETRKELLFTQYAVDTCAFPIFWAFRREDVSDTEIIHANRAAKDLLGYEDREIAGLSLGTIAADLTDEQWRSICNDASFSLITKIYRKDFTSFPAELYGSCFVYQGQGYYFSFFRDVSKQQDMEEKLHRSMKMEAIGMMAGGVAHDLNNILSGIVSYPELMLMKLPADSEWRTPLEAIHSSGQRAAGVVADLLTIARGAAAVRKNRSLNVLVQEFMDTPECAAIRHSYPDLQWVLKLDDHLLNIICSPVHITKCLMNLVLNGAEAVEADGTITIETQNLYVEQEIVDNQPLTMGEYVVLLVSDDGPGIADEDQEHIFEPFYSKKAMGKSGTGLGLAVVWNTIQDHGGRIIIDSSPAGSCFKMFFPATREEIDIDTREVNEKDVRGHGETVLVVDDDSQQRDIATQILLSLDYQTHAVESGAEAVAYLLEHKVDLLVLDMIMEQGMNGRETYEKIIENQPDQKALIASGYALGEDVERLKGLGVSTFVKKPYTLYQLGLAVQETLAGEENNA